MKKSILFFAFCFMFLAQGPVKAQSTNEYAILEALAAQAVFASSPTVQSSHLKFELLTLDALTKGKVTSDTTQIVVVLKVTNDSPNYYSKLLIASNVFGLANTITGAGINVTNNIQPTISTWNNVAAFSSHYLVLTSLPITPAHGAFNSGLTAHELIYTGLFNINSSIPTRPDGIIASNVENIIYEPFNGDLIPTILRDVSRR